MQQQSQISDLRSPFRATVEEAFCIHGSKPNTIRGTVLVVKVVAGVIKSGAQVFVTSRPGLTLTITGIERNRVLVDEAYITERVGLMMKDIDLSTVQPGEVVCTEETEGPERALSANKPSHRQVEHAKEALSIASQFLPEEFVVFDVETTGLDPKTDVIIEIGAVLVRRSQVISGDETFQSLQTLIRIDKPVPAHISSLTGISDNMLRENGVQLSEAIEEFKGFVGNRRLVAYNAKFDISFMREAMGRYGFTLSNPVSCALDMARRAWPERPSFKLQELARAIDVDQEHRAVSDTVRALIVYLSAVRELHAHE